MNSDIVTIIGVVALGAVSLYMLLGLIRDLAPSIFAPETQKLDKVGQSTAALGQAFGQEVAAGPSTQLLASIKGANPKKRTAKLTTAKRLKYASWRISPRTYHLFALSISGLVFSLVASRTNFAIQILAILSGPVFMRCLVMFCVTRRASRFDADYAQFLMSMVGLLKTGMTPSGALETAARGLDPRSLVRNEVALMLERIRVGVLEDRSIGSFAEDIYHPEIELFVQALLLSRRVGGNLSESLERLSKQVRKRQYFRSSASAAVGLQRGSLVVILGILVCLQGYIAMVYPSLVLDGLKSEWGWQVWQICFALIVVAFFWARQVTNIKV